MKPTLLVLAAGIGSRYGGLKQIDTVGPSCEVVLDYSVYDALRAGFGKIVFVIRHEIETDFKEIVGRKYEERADVHYVFQELDRLPSGYEVPENRSKPWGTAHATLMAEEAIGEPFAVINADDYYGVSAFQLMGDYLSRRSEDDTNYAMVGFTLRDTLSEHGHVARGICECDGSGKLVRVVERTQIEKDGRGARFIENDGSKHPLTGDEVVSMNFWGFTPSLFPHLREHFAEFLEQNHGNPKAEFFIPTVVDRLISEDKATVEVLPTRSAWYGITYKEDKPLLINGIRELIQQGEYPQKLFE
jgi:dTDP-glucose pyrophosphorylase